MKVLIATAETKNLYQAAERLQVSQAFISVKLKELESLMPFPVFGHQGRRKVMTKFGHDLYRLALIQSQDWLKSIERLNRKYGDVEQLLIKIGGRPETIEAFIYNSNFKGCMDLKVMSSSEAINKLLSHEVDIAISHKVPNSSEIIAKKIFDSTAQLIVHRQWLKGKYNDLINDKDFLTRTPCLLYTENGQLTREWFNHLEIPFDLAQVRAITEDWRTIRHLVEEKKGFSIVPSYLNSNNKNLVSLPLPVTIMPRFTFYACYHKDLRKVPAFRELFK